MPRFRLTLPLVILSFCPFRMDITGAMPSAIANDERKRQSDPQKSKSSKPPKSKKKQPSQESGKTSIPLPKRSPREHLQCEPLLTSIASHPKNLSEKSKKRWETLAIEEEKYWALRENLQKDRGEKPLAEIQRQEGEVQRQRNTLLDVAKDHLANLTLNPSRAKGDPRVFKVKRPSTEKSDSHILEDVLILHPTETKLKSDSPPPSLVIWMDWAYHLTGVTFAWSPDSREGWFDPITNTFFLSLGEILSLQPDPISFPSRTDQAFEKSQTSLLKFKLSEGDVEQADENERPSRPVSFFALNQFNGVEGGWRYPVRRQETLATTLGEHVFDLENQRFELDKSMDGIDSDYRVSDEFSKDVLQSIRSEVVGRSEFLIQETTERLFSETIADFTSLLEIKDYLDSIASGTSDELLHFHSNAIAAFLRHPSWEVKIGLWKPQEVKRVNLPDGPTRQRPKVVFAITRLYPFSETTDSGSEEPEKNQVISMLFSTPDQRVFQAAKGFIETDDDPDLEAFFSFLNRYLVPRLSVAKDWIDWLKISRRATYKVAKKIVQADTEKDEKFDYFQAAQKLVEALEDAGEAHLKSHPPFPSTKERENSTLSTSR